MEMRGFTVIELVAVLVVIGVVAVVVMPRSPNGPSMTLNARAQRLAADVRFAQWTSVTSGQRHCLTFTSSSPYSGYSLTTGSSNCTTSIPHPGLADPSTFCQGTNCLTAPVLSSGYLQFDTLGQPYVTATTPLAANAVITISDGGVTQSVTVSPVTGRVSVP